MPGIKYHPNAKTTVHIRKIIKESNEPILSLAKLYNLTKATVLNYFPCLYITIRLLAKWFNIMRRLYKNLIYEGQNYPSQNY